jgi:aspartyl-tRNA(Asn)/glutamyl-tRNA(Gln) amidotransferase subunit C
MISKKDVQNLADLSRIEITEDETTAFAPELDSILEYVGQIKNATGDMERATPKLRNVLRDDVITNKKEEYTEKLLKNMPAREKNYLKVKKILG